MQEVKPFPEAVKEKVVRPSKDEYYLQIAKEIGSRSTCFRHWMGTIIVKDDQIIATGYIGAPRKTKDCLERGECLRDKLKIPHGTRYEICRSVHAEQNAIINAARAGVSLMGGDMYMHSINPKTGLKNDALPCFFCKRMIINAGIKRVISAAKEGGVKIFLVEEWAKDWKENDIVDDKQQYGADQNIRDGLTK
jgi:dCMP deaminase